MYSVCQVNKSDLNDMAFISGDLSGMTGIKDGQVLLKIENFSFTANNITYAVMGDRMNYWKFFPAEEGKGIIPVWGFATVEQSGCSGIEPGEKFYGYYPMATHLVVEPANISKGGFEDGAEHRKGLPIIYNQYRRCSVDPLYRPGTESLQMLLRPLFTTSFLLDYFFDSNDFFSSRSVVLTSASSKTAFGMAFLMNRNRAERKQAYEIVGLTSSGNTDFVEKLGCYDRIYSYDQLTSLDGSAPASYVDFAGNSSVLKSLHDHYGDNLRYACLVGASHWDMRTPVMNELKGVRPVLFFAPSEGEKIIREKGMDAFQSALGEGWTDFVDFVDQKIFIKKEKGASAVITAYQDVLAGRASPETGYIFSLAE